MNYFICHKCNGTFDPAHKHCPVCDGVTVAEQADEITELRTKLASSESALNATLDALNRANDRLAAAHKALGLAREALEEAVDMGLATVHLSAALLAIKEAQDD